MAAERGDRSRAELASPASTGSEHGPGDRPGHAAPGSTPASLPRRRALRITAVAGLGLALGGSVVAELLRRGRLHRVRDTRTRMGTLVTITVLHPDPAGGRRLIEVAFAEIGRLEAILSRHRPDTPLARLNRDGAIAGAPAELVEVLGHARAHSARTGGAFDVTVAPLLDLYAARFRDRGRAPGDAEVEEALGRVGWRDLEVGEREAALRRRGMAVTLDGIAKGFVVDRAVASLVAEGAGPVLVDAGGDMAAAGAGSADPPWRVAVQHPRDPGSALGTLELRGGALATSGDYMQAFTPDRSLHHILDPRTGRSPAEVSSVTVRAPTAMDADALSTAVLVMGPDAGVALLEDTPGAAGLVVSKDGRVARSRGFDLPPVGSPG